MGLTLKLVGILALVVLGVTATGGWLHYEIARATLRRQDWNHASRTAQAMCLSAQHALRDGQRIALQRLATDYLRNRNVLFASVIDADGKVLASACSVGGKRRWEAITSAAPSVSMTQQVNDNVLALARPIVMRDVIWWEDRHVGGVRLAMDTRATTAALSLVQRRMAVIAVGLVLCAIPMGLLLASRSIVQPMQRLVDATRQLARGDFSARAHLTRRDELGELASAFDYMASQVEFMRNELLEANEQLERKVAERTADLGVANKRLRQEMAEKEDFLRAVSHDLNAPLRNIAGMAMLIVTKWADALPEEVLSRLKRIQSNVEAESSLIAELLELSRVKTRPQRPTMVDMADLMESLAHTFEYELKKQEIELRAEPDLPVLYVEKTRMVQLFQNLIDNAIKYMDRQTGGRIEVGYRLHEGMHEFSVADNGPGIPLAEQDRIFHVFRRVKTTRTSQVEGKGVGLALVKAIASKYSGRAWIESELGKGSTFFVSLSVEDTSPPKVEEGSDGPPEQVEEAQLAGYPAG